MIAMKIKTGRNSVRRFRLDYFVLSSVGLILIVYSIVTLKTFQHLDRKLGHVPVHSMITPHWELHRSHDIHVTQPSANEDIGNHRVKQVLLTQPPLPEASLWHVPFPQSIYNEELETIVHPALVMRPKSEMNNKTIENSPAEIILTVPKFWNPNIFHPDLRTYLGNNGERLITPGEASKIGSFAPAWDSGKPLETIFVAISSYRDPRCRHTVEAIFNRASHPERIRVAIVDQIDDEDEPCISTDVSCHKYPYHIMCKFPNLIDVYVMNAGLAVGPVFARHIGHRMYRGETFAMQTDAHMEFVEDWDTDLVEQWKATKNEMAVLTTYVSDVENHFDIKTNTRTTNVRPLMCDSNFVDDYYYENMNFLQHGEQPEYEPVDVTGEPCLEPFWAAGFSFARGHFVVQVPYDQYLPMVFQGEEINIGVRGFTYGYDYYAPERSVLFHYYNVGPNQETRKKVPTFWENSPVYTGVESESKARLEGIISMLPPVRITSNDTLNVYASDIEWNHIEEKKYGIGQVRSVQKFLDTFGIHLAERRVEGNLCSFVGAPMHYMFTSYLRENAMGIDYDRIDFQFKDPKIYGISWKTNNDDVELL